MKKMLMALLGFLFVAACLIQGNIFAEENTNAAVASVEELKAAEASLASLPEGSVPVDEELRDKEVIDTDA